MTTKNFPISPAAPAEEIILSIAAIQAIPGVKSIKLHEPTGRYYINLAGNGGNFAGERNSKVYMTPDGTIIVERGKGTTSRAWDDQKNAVIDAAQKVVA